MTEIMLQRLILIWLLLSSGLAWVWPLLGIGFDPFLAAGGTAIDILIVSAMFAVGGLLPLDEVNRLARTWPAVLGGTAVQYVTMPLAAWTVIRLFSIQGDLATGIMIVGCVPGAMASNVLTLVARGNVSYSVSLTTSATLLSPLIVPAVLKLTLGQDVAYRGTDAVFALLTQIVIPVVAGHLCSRSSERFRNVADRAAAVVANLSILAIIAIAVALRRDEVAAAFGRLLLPLMVLNVVGYSAGMLAAGPLRLEQGRKRALTLEVGMQNAGAGVALAAQLFGPQTAALVPCVLYTFGCMLTGTMLATWWHWWTPAATPAVQPVPGPE